MSVPGQGLGKDFDADNAPSIDLSPVVEMLCEHDVPELLALRDRLRSEITVLEIERVQVNKALERKLPSVDDVQGILRG